MGHIGNRKYMERKASLENSSHVTGVCPMFDPDKCAKSACTIFRIFLSTEYNNSGLRGASERPGCSPFGFD